jgi:hypothetical protein
MRKHFAQLFCLSCCFSLAVPVASVAAEPGSDDEVPPSLLARLKRANAQFEEGNLNAALAEYRRLQEESGKTPGLFNVGHICARLDRPVEAVDAFNKLLSNPGRTPPDRLEEARRMRDEQIARIGFLVLWTTVPAFVEVDNVAAGRSEKKVVDANQTEDNAGATPGVRYAMEKPIAIGNGLHVVAAIAPGHAPLRMQVEIGGGVTREVNLPLAPAKGELAHIRVKTSVPGADILLNGDRVGSTPIDVSLPVVAGPYDLTLKRLGYHTASLRRDLREGQTWDAEVTMEENPAETAQQGGELALVGLEPGTALSVDGKLRDLRGDGVHLPAGLHDIELGHSGFLPYRTQVDIESGQVRRMRVDMEPTAEARHERLSKASGQRWRAWGTLAAGALIAGGGALYLRSALSDRTQANSDFDNVQAQLKPGAECSPLGKRDEIACQAKVDRANDEVSTTDHKVLGGYIATGVGAAALVTGMVLVLTVDDVSRYELRGDLAWFGWASPSGGVVGLAGRF